MSQHGRLFECTIPKDCSGLQTAIEEFLSPKKVWFRVEKRLHEPSRRYHTNVKVALSVELNIFQLLNELKSVLIDHFSDLSEEDIVTIEATNGYCVLFDVTEMSGLSMESFLAKMTLSKDLDLKTPARKLYSRDSDGHYCIISAVSCLRDKHKYYFFTEGDKLQVNPPLEYNTGNQEVSNAKSVNFNSMDKFYEALRENRHPDKYIQVISDAFDQHGINHVNLPGLTDDKLKEIRLLIGYRTEILHVLGKKF
ncbi:hypothetical protein MP638_002161 [Amoeboaphelidium occidentale]|nr:hypothetical protein MP638_002161 [Amoeboaphelidium occidentale]